MLSCLGMNYSCIRLNLFRQDFSRSAGIDMEFSFDACSDEGFRWNLLETHTERSALTAPENG